MNSVVFQWAVVAIAVVVCWTWLFIALGYVVETVLHTTVKKMPPHVYVIMLFMLFFFWPIEYGMKLAGYKGEHKDKDESESDPFFTVYK